MKSNFIILCFLSFGNIALSQISAYTKFEETANIFLSTYVSNGFVDYENVQLSELELDDLINQIELLDLSDLSESQRLAFYINAYNLLVIAGIVEKYPITSVKEIGGFFDRKKHKVAGENLSLNTIEKDILLKKYNDPRYHFALICGAIDCPRIRSEAIMAASLDAQLEDWTRRSLNDPLFVKRENDKVGISEIFKWYIDDFKGSKSGVLEFINKYVDEPLVKSNVSYYNYNWTLNDTKYSTDIGKTGVSNNSFRYVTSAAIPKGGVEAKVFNNLYSQNDGSRSTYFTTSFNFLYGISNRFNLGFTGRYRRARNSSLPSSAFDVFQELDGISGRQRITAIGPQIRWAPFKSLEGFSLQSSLTMSIGDQLQGDSGGSIFLDWDGPVFQTQFFNDRSIGDYFSLFTEVDVVVEGIGGDNNVSFPMTAIFSWFPQSKMTVYGLVGFAPALQRTFEYYRQIGLGYKYQVSRNFEIELLATNFSNRYLNDVNGSAATYNIGFRYSRN